MTTIRGEQSPTYQGPWQEWDRPQSSYLSLPCFRLYCSRWVHGRCSLSPLRPCSTPGHFCWGLVGGAPSALACFLPSTPYHIAAPVGPVRLGKRKSIRSCSLHTFAQTSNFCLPSAAICLGRLLLPTTGSLCMVEPSIRYIDKLPSVSYSIFP
jgi:hypothetical protein